MIVSHMLAEKGFQSRAVKIVRCYCQFIKHKTNYKQGQDTQLPWVLTFLASHFQLLRSKALKESVLNLKMSREPCDVHFTKEIK